ncbi:MAG: hypothetical protein HFH09_02775 [Bacilli bacterium]|nr:hypothetical protein [Bacilli bacterium]
MEKDMLTIKREQMWVDADISYQVIINGVNMCTLDNGQIKNLDLKKGDYKIQIRSSRFQSIEIPFSITDGSHVEFVCKSNYKNTKMSIFIHRVLKKNVGIHLELKQDIYL